ncbi:MAG: hypothetical protein LQ339_006395 [Xanthoria mediterranea]|nr:MAG: hypothetical protein LQ339_006395 [Xanthoria mediterranea]
MASKRKDPWGISETSSPKRRRITRTAASVNAINYDQKYHPMDDITRPAAAAAAARRAAHGLDDDTSCSSTTRDSATLVDQSDHSSDSVEFTRAREVKTNATPTRQPARSKSGTRSDLGSSRGPDNNPSSLVPTRRPVRVRSGSPSNRRVTRGDVYGEKIVQYSAKHHPMDDIIRPKQAKKVLARTGAIANSPAPVIASPKSPNVSETELQFSGWKSLDTQDRLLFSLQKGAPPYGVTLPLLWPDVIQALRKLRFPVEVVNTTDLQQRYKIICRKLSIYYSSANEPAKQNDQELFYAEAFDLYTYEAGDRYWKHRIDSIASLDTPVSVDEAATDEDNLSIRGGYNDAEGYIRQSYGIIDSETQDSTEAELLSSLRNQLSVHLDDIPELDMLSQNFHSSANYNDDDNRRTTTINANPEAADDPLQPDSGMIRGPLKRRFHNPRSKTQPTFSVHEDEPSNTPKIKRQIAMKTRSPGTDLPKENWSGRSSSHDESSFSTQE